MAVLYSIWRCTWVKEILFCSLNAIFIAIIHEHNENESNSPHYAKACTLKVKTLVNICEFCTVVLFTTEFTRVALSATLYLGWTFSHRGIVKVWSNWSKVCGRVWLCGRVFGQQMCNFTSAISRTQLRPNNMGSFEASIWLFQTHTNKVKLLKTYGWIEHRHCAQRRVYAEKCGALTMIDLCLRDMMGWSGDPDRKKTNAVPCTSWAIEIMSHNHLIQSWPLDFRCCMKRPLVFHTLLIWSNALLCPDSQNRVPNLFFPWLHVLSYKESNSQCCWLTSSVILEPETTTSESMMRSFRGFLYWSCHLSGTHFLMTITETETLTAGQLPCLISLPQNTSDVGPCLLC